MNAANYSINVGLQPTKVTPLAPTLLKLAARITTFLTGERLNWRATVVALGNIHPHETTAILARNERTPGVPVLLSDREYAT